MTQTCILSLRYSGGLAEYGLMRPFEAEQAMRGARSLLVTSAQVYVHGQVVSRHASYRHFDIYEAAPEKGSVIRDLAIGISGSALYDVAKEGCSPVFIAVTAAAIALIASQKVGWWIELGKKLADCEPIRMGGRIEPNLPWPQKRPNQWPPIYLPELPEKGKTGRPLRDLNQHPVTRAAAEAIAALARPVERGAASHLNVSLDGEDLFRLGATMERPRRLDEAKLTEIARALDQIRYRRRSR